MTKYAADNGEVIEIEGVGAPGTFTMTTKVPPYLHADAWRDYLWNHCREKDQDIRRVGYVAKHWLRVMDPGAEVATWKRKNIQMYIDARRSDGVMNATIRREMSLMQAALNFAHKWERLDKPFKFDMPSGQARPRRALTEEELERILASKVTRRIWLFYTMVKWTGHRSRAIETLTWDRVHFEERLINFNEPGKRITNKRRNGSFPIPDELLVILIGAKKWADKRTPHDPYVIGLGPRGKVSTTFHPCKAACIAVGIDEEGICRHAVRKTFVTARVKRGIPRPLVAKLIADNPATMDKHYFLPESDDLREAANMRLN